MGFTLVFGMHCELPPLLERGVCVCVPMLCCAR